MGYRTVKRVLQEGRPIVDISFFEEDPHTPRAKRAPVTAEDDALQCVATGSGLGRDEGPHRGPRGAERRT